jgi:hypothetical protein
MIFYSLSLANKDTYDAIHNIYSPMPTCLYVPNKCYFFWYPHRHLRRTNDGHEEGGSVSFTNNIETYTYMKVTLWLVPQQNNLSFLFLFFHFLLNHAY